MRSSSLAYGKWWLTRSGNLEKLDFYDGLSIMGGETWSLTKDNRQRQIAVCERRSLSGMVAFVRDRWS